MINKITPLLMGLLLAGCASNPDKIASAYVSPLKYKNYDCDQLSMEMDRVGQKTTQIYRRLKSEHTADSWQAGLGLFLFWPALFFLEGSDGPEAAEYSQLKGEFKALEENVLLKKCAISKPSPDDIIKGHQERENS